MTLPCCIKQRCLVVGVDLINAAAGRNQGVKAFNVALPDVVVKAGLLEGVSIVWPDPLFSQGVHHGLGFWRAFDQGCVIEGSLFPLVIDDGLDI